MTPEQAAGARDRLEALANDLLEASVSVLTAGERAAFDVCTGLDVTPVPLFSRGPSRRAGLSASDPDGGWYVREGDHRNREDGKSKPLPKICRALEATIAATARPPAAPPATPNLAIGLAMAPARRGPRRRWRPRAGLGRRPRPQKYVLREKHWAGHDKRVN